VDADADDAGSAMNPSVTIKANTSGTMIFFTLSPMSRCVRADFTHNQHILNYYFENVNVGNKN